MKIAVALGANLGDRLSALRAATERIDSFAPVVARSRVYETKPVGGPGPDYFNAAILVDWSGTPIELLDRLQAIESDLGRVRSFPNAPRTIDLDILWIEGGITIETERLVVPHPRLHERAFALRPLLDVAPAAARAKPEMIQDPGCRIVPDVGL